MTNEKAKFWVSCPQCKRKFGVSHQIVLKYVDRLFNEAAARLAGNANKFPDKQKPQK